MEKNEKPMPDQKSSFRERMNDISTIMVKKDGKWVWLDNGEEVKNPPAEVAQATTATAEPKGKKKEYGEFYKPSDK